MTLTEEIKKKFGSMRRFAEISNYSYYKIIESMRHNRKKQQAEILNMVRSYKDRPLPGEVTPELRKEIARLWANCDQKQIKGEFPYHWIDSLISGSRRMFVTGKVKRLIKRMEQLANEYKK